MRQFAEMVEPVGSVVDTMTVYVVPPLQAADIEDLAIYFLTPILSPTPVDTRLPRPADNADTINGFVTVEAAGISRSSLASWDLSYLMHAYSPVEAEAADISGRAMAYATAAQGQKVMGWFIVGLVTAIGSQKLANPDVAELARYRSAVTWRVAGHPI